MSDDVLTPILSTSSLSVRTRDGKLLLREVSLEVPRRMVTAIIGPSGAGKSTLLKCLNRLIDLDDSLSVSGSVLFDGIDTRDGAVDADDLRRRIGIVFQQPVILPGSIERNVLFGASRVRRLARADASDLVESALKEACLWNEVRDRLRQPAITLSVGQQQRLAIARTLAVGPEVILLDEPTSALDPQSTAAVEETILSLKSTRTIVLVTHQLEQARRLAGWVACLCTKDGAGELMEADRCESVFCCPTRPETAAFLRAVR